MDRSHARTHARTPKLVKILKVLFPVAFLGAFGAGIYGFLADDWLGYFACVGMGIAAAVMFDMLDNAKKAK